MNELGSHDRLRQRLTACAAIAGIHVGLFLVLTAARPDPTRTVAAPLEVGFISEQPRTPEPWQPPAPDVAPVTVMAMLPQAVDTVLAAVPAENAITVAPASATDRPATRGMNTPKLISAVEYERPPVPRYPHASRRQKEQGVVVLLVLIDPSGRAVQIEVHQSSGYVRLDHAAREAVAHAKFKPYIENGTVQAAFVLVPIEFSLKRSG